MADELDSLSDAQIDALAKSLGYGAGSATGAGALVPTSFSLDSTPIEQPSRFATAGNDLLGGTSRVFDTASLGAFKYLAAAPASLGGYVANKYYGVPTDLSTEYQKALGMVIQAQDAFGDAARSVPLGSVAGIPISDIPASFATPLIKALGALKYAPALGKATLGGRAINTATNLGKAALEGAATSGIEGALNTQVDWNERASAAWERAGTGALLSGGLSTLGGILSKGVDAYRGVARTVRAVGGDEDLIAEMASQKILDVAGASGRARIAAIQQNPSLGLSPMGAQMSAAEALQSPGVAVLQAQVAKDPQVMSILVDALDRRARLAREGISDIGPVPAPGELSGVLRDEFSLADAAKGVEESRILGELGLTPEARQSTRMEQGRSIRKVTSDEMKAADKVVKDTWLAVPQEVKVNIAEPLSIFLKGVDELGPLARAEFSERSEGIISKARGYLRGSAGEKPSVPLGFSSAKVSEATLGTPRGEVSVHLLQDLRRAAGGALVAAKKAGGNTEAKALSELRELIDTHALKAAESANVSPESMILLGNAIGDSKAFFDKYKEGAVGDITARRGKGPKLLGSEVLSRALKSPESVGEFVSKFGRGSAQHLELRTGLLKQLEAQEKPIFLLAQKEDIYREAFGEDYGKIWEYAKSREQGVGWQKFANIRDSGIPAAVFESEGTARAFALQFADSDILKMAQSRLMSDLTSSGVGAAKKFAKQRKVVEGLFGSDFPEIEKIFADMEGSASPGVLGQKATGRQSITSQANTVMGFLFSGKGLESRVRAVEKGGSALGASLGAGLGGYLGGWVGATIGGGLGTLAGVGASSTASETLLKMNRLRAEMLANPVLIRLGALPPTRKNLDAFMRRASKIGGAGTGGEETPSIAAPTDKYDSMSDAEIDALAKSLGYGAAVETPTPAPEKQNMSMLGDVSIINEAEADAPTSKAMARLEKASKGFNVEKEIAGASKMVRAVARVESNLKHASISSAGAIGLMQLMPTTAEDLGVDPYDPKQNLAGGQKYLENLSARFKNDKLTFAAYNMGPEALRKAIREAGTRDWARIVKNLGVYNSKSNKKGVPAETIAYVTKVMNLYRG